MNDIEFAMYYVSLNAWSDARTNCNCRTFKLFLSMLFRVTPHLPNMYLGKGPGDAYDGARVGQAT